MRYRSILFLSLVCLAGCMPSLSKSDLGTVHDELPKVAGAEKPYEMPELGPPLEKSKDRDPRLLH